MSPVPPSLRRSLADVMLVRESPEESAEAEMSRRTSSRLTAPYFNPPNPHDYVASFESQQPAGSRDLRLGRSSSHTVSSEDEADGPRAGTWASNLRDTLFAAIQGVRGPAISDIEEGDNYTHAVTPLSNRRSSRQDRRPSTPGPRGDVESSDIIAGYFLTPSLSASTSSESDTLRQTRTAPVKQFKRLSEGLKGKASDRYKRYYSRGSSNGRGSPSSDESSAGSSGSWSALKSAKAKRAEGAEVKTSA